MKRLLISFGLAGVCVGGVAARWAPSETSPDVTGPAHVAIQRIDALTRSPEAGPPVDDATFLRRVTLDLVGRIPTVEECRRFEEDASPNKRARWTAELLQSPGFTSHLFHLWADMLRVRTKLQRQVEGDLYLAWLQDAIARDVPYDQMVRTMVTAEGAAYDAETPEVGYVLRDRGMLEDHVANTMRVFAGTRLECAQCHDDPDGRWTQRQFFEVAAFSGGLQFDLDDPARKALTDKRRELADEPRLQRALRDLQRARSMGVEGGGSGLIRAPKDVLGDDLTPAEWIAAHTPFREVVATDLPDGTGRRAAKRIKRQAREESGTREEFAAWLTSPDHPRFTHVIANRLWAHIFGRGLVEPLDDWSASTEVSRPELLDELVRTMKALDYDLRAFVGVLVSTEAYQRPALAFEAPDSTPVAPRLRRLSAEQIWDSLVTLAVEDVDAGLGRPTRQRSDDLLARKDLAGQTTVDELVAEAREVLDQRASMARDAKARRQASKRSVRNETKAIKKDLKKATRAGDDEQAVALRDALTEARESAKRPTKRSLWRASDLSSPARPGHLLRQFGQSDRDQIDAGHDQSTVPQVLSLLHGFTETHLLGKRGSALQSQLQLQDEPAHAVEHAFLAVLGRRPTSEEQSLWKREVAERGREATDDLIWVLVNCHEFRFVR